MIICYISVSYGRHPCCHSTSTNQPKPPTINPIHQTKFTKPNQINQTKLPNHIHQTESTKPNPPSQTHQTTPNTCNQSTKPNPPIKSTKPIHQNQLICQTWKTNVCKPGDPAQPNGMFYAVTRKAARMITWPVHMEIMCNRRVMWACIDQVGTPSSCTKGSSTCDAATKKATWKNNTYCASWQ